MKSLKLCLMTLYHPIVVTEHIKRHRGEKKNWLPVIVLLVLTLAVRILRQRVVAVDFQRLLPVVQCLGIAAVAVQRHRLMDELDEVRGLKHGDRPRVVVQHIQEALAVMVDGHGRTT